MLDVKDSLAVTYAKQGDGETATRMHKEVRDIRLLTTGKSHPDILRTERWLARAWRMGEHIEKVRALNEQVLQTWLDQFGHDHPHTQSCAMSLWRSLIIQAVYACSLCSDCQLILHIHMVMMLRPRHIHFGYPNHFAFSVVICQKQFAANPSITACSTVVHGSLVNTVARLKVRRKARTQSTQSRGQGSRNLKRYWRVRFGYCGFPLSSRITQLEKCEPFAQVFCCNSM